MITKKDIFKQASLQSPLQDIFRFNCCLHWHFSVIPTSLKFLHIKISIVTEWTTVTQLLCVLSLCTAEKKNLYQRQKSVTSFCGDRNSKVLPSTFSRQVEKTSLYFLFPECFNAPLFLLFLISDSDYIPVCVCCVPVGFAWCFCTICALVKWRLLLWC